MPPLGPEIIADVTSTSSGTSHSFTLPAFTDVDDTYAVYIQWALSAGTVAASPISGNLNNFTVTDTPETAWVRRSRHQTSNDNAGFVAELWTGSQFSIDPSEADFTTNVSATAACTAVVINTHNASVLPIVEIGAQPNTGGSDGEVDHSGDSSFGEVEPQLYVDNMMGKVSEGAVSTTPASPPSGYTALTGVQGGSVAGTVLTHYPICYLAWKSSPSGQSSENPGAWVWDEVSDVTTPANSSLISVLFSTFSFEDFTPDAEEDFPYWGLLGAMA